MAGSITIVNTYAKQAGGMNKTVATWTSDASGDVNSVDKLSIAGLIHRIVTNPSATAPTNLYDIVLNDEDGLDVAKGLLANRSATVSEEVTPLVGDGTTTDKLVAVAGTLDVVVTNAGNAKIGAITVYWR